MSLPATRLRCFLISSVIAGVSVLKAAAATFNVSGTTLAINLTAANESVAITAGASHYSFALTGGTWSGTDSVDATGNSTATLSALKASFTAVTVEDGSTGNALTFNTSGANTYDSSFSVTLDDATAGTITFNGNTAFAGSAAFSASTSRNMVVASGAVVSVVNGNLTLSANQQATPTEGTFAGVLVNNAVVQSLGAGVVSLTGRGGNIGAFQFGVRVAGTSARIQSTSGNVTVTGTGGASDSDISDGLRVESGGKITTAGSGGLTIVGTGGGGNAATAVSHVGVRIVGAEVSTVDGPLSITGTGGAPTNAAAGGQYGIVAAAAAQIKATGNGTLTLDGRGGGVTGTGFNEGVQIANPGTLVTVKDGQLTITGNYGAGSGGSALDIDDFGSVTSTGTGNMLLQSERSIILNTGAVVSTVNGNLTLSANQQTTPTSASFVGVTVVGTVSSTGSGNVLVRGKGGTTAGNFGINVSNGTISGGTAGSTVTVTGTGGGGAGNNYRGVTIGGATATITSRGGNVIVDGTGGGSSSGSGTFCYGVDVRSSCTITAGGSGTVTVTGTGGLGTGGGHFGVHVLTAAIITSSGGSVTVTGTGGQIGAGVVANGGTITAGGLASLTIVGTGTGGSSTSFGVNLSAARQSVITSAGGNVNITGIASPGAGAADLQLDPGSFLGSGGNLTVQLDSLFLNTTGLPSSINVGGNTLQILPLTPTTRIDLGGADMVGPPATLGISAAELARMFAGTIRIGETNTPSIVVSANITLPLATALNLTAAGIDFGTNAVTAGSVRRTIAGQADLALEQPAGYALANGASPTIGGVAVGSSEDLVFTVRNAGFASLTGLAVTIDGANAGEFSVFASPAGTVAAGTSTTFTIRFSPTSGGAKTAVLRLLSNDPDESAFEVTLTAAAFSARQLVGPTGDFTSLTAAIAFLQANTLTGPLVLELQPAYVSTVETFPLVFTNLGTTATNTLTIRPQAGATALSITSANTTTVDLNGAQFVTIDGRPGGVDRNAWSGGGLAAQLTAAWSGGGRSSQLTIANTSTSGAALRFVNEASKNAIRYTTLRGVNTSTSSGTVVFGTTTGANGNDDKTIDHCDLRDGATTPANGLYALGSTGGNAPNSGNTISNCNFFNFYGVGDHFGILLSNGNTDWTLTGNSFYQTVARPGPSSTGTGGGIFISSASGNNFVITNNAIGGSAPNAEGVAWTVNGTAVLCRFAGITLNAGTTTPSSIQGNMVRNITWLTTFNQPALPGIWSGILLTGGSANIGTVAGNTIGSGTGTGSISVTTSGDGGATFGIASSSSGTVAFANNTIGAITANGSAATVSASLGGIQVTAGTNTISNNLVGSTTTANSLNAATASTSATGQSLTGILSSSSTSANLTGNTVANLNNAYTGTSTGSQTRGIVTSAGANAIGDNTVRDLTSAAGSNGVGSSSVLIGILQNSGSGNQSVTQNLVHSLSQTNGTVSVVVQGIIFNAGTTGMNLVQRNFVHSLRSVSTGASATINGMLLTAGTMTVANNVIRVGLDASGASVSAGTVVRGIFDSGSSEGRSFLHNSVFVGGTPTAGANSTFAFSSSGRTNARTFRNNIFVNARSNSGGTGKHYAVAYGGTTANPTGLTAGGNLFFAPGTGGVFGLFNGIDCISLADWQAATGQDATSLHADPLFLNPTGTATTVDLHLSSTSPANNAGLAPADVTDDFDGRIRSLSAPDIGADEIGIATPTAPTVARDAEAVTVPEGTIAFNSGTFADVNSDLVTVTASIGTITQSAIWAHQQTLTQGGNPIELTLDSQENLYVVNPAQNTLYKYNSSGSLVTSWTVTGAPTGVAVDSANGWLYVILKDGRRIDKFTLSGTLLTSWGSFGSGDGQFNAPHCVAVDAAGDVYVADSFNSRIQVFSPAGAFLRKWGTAGSGDGQFNFPQGLRVSPGGTLYVADRNNNRVQYFNTAGTFLGKWGSSGNGNGQFSAPAGIGIDPGGNVVVGDIGNNRIQIFTATGTYMDKLGPSTTVGNLSLPHGTAFPPSGRSVYIADFINGRVVKFATPGGWNWSHTPADGAAGPTTVTITATDNGSPNLSSTTTFTLNVNNVAPTIALTGNPTVASGTPYTLNLGAITDPGTDTVSAFSINWGDGNTENFTGNPASTAKTHTYATLGAKTITVTLTDEDGTVTGGTRSVTVVNTPPTFSGYSLTTKKNTAATIGLAKLLARAADSDGGTPAVSSVSAVSSQGGSVSLTATSVIYTPANNFTGLDTFTLTIIDGQGDSVTGTVTVNVSDATGPGSNQASQIVLQPGGEVSVLFFGIPGQAYQIQRSADLQTWSTLTTVNAAADGSLPWIDPNPLPGSGFYRTLIP